MIKFQRKQNKDAVRYVEKHYHVLSFCLNEQLHKFCIPKQTKQEGMGDLQRVL